MNEPIILHSERYKASLRTLFPLLPEKVDSAVLITGATGLIGSCLADAILLSNAERKTDFKVIALGRNEVKLKNRFSYAQNDIEYRVQDINEPVSRRIKPDIIFHAAGNADPVSYALYPVQTLLSCIYGTKNMLDLAEESDATMLFTSTFEVYGKIDGNDVYSENMSGVIDQTALRSCYPESKRNAELLVRCYVRQYGVSAVIARLCSIYGPTMQPNDSKAHAQFIRNGVGGENIVLKSAGSSRRTYCYVTDAIAGMLLILKKGKNGEAYNVSNEKSCASIAQVAHVIADICGREVVYDQPDEIESSGFSKPQNCILDNEKLRLLGFRGRYSLEEGLRETIEILKEANQ